MNPAPNHAAKSKKLCFGCLQPGHKADKCPTNPVKHRGHSAEYKKKRAERYKKYLSKSQADSTHQSKANTEDIPLSMNELLEKINESAKSHGH